MLVSVYVPTRNRVGLLAKAVESVLNQSYKDIELVVVDDASTDGTPEFLRERSARDPRLVCFRNESAGGAPAARNLAITRARGEFVTGLDDDDEFHVERISTFVEYWDLLTKRGLRPACLYSQDYLVFNKAEAFPVSRKRGSTSAVTLLEENSIGNQIYAPRSHFIEAGLFDETLPAWQDLDFFVRVLSRFGTAYLVDVPTYYFDFSPRTDRISSNESKVRSAFMSMVKKHNFSTPKQSQTLFLQMFSEVYGFRPGLKDWVQFVKWGFWPQGIYTLLRATVRRNVRDKSKPLAS